MRLRRLHTPSSVEGVNVTPMIDVVMCLIIFFLIVGKLAHDQVAGMRLPQTRIGEGEGPRGGIVISISPARAGEAGAVRWSAEGIEPALFARVRVQQQEVQSAGELQQALQTALGPTAPGAARVQVRADRDAPYGLVEPAMRSCRALGISGVMLVTERRP